MIDEKEMFVDAKIYRHPEYELTAETLAYHEAGHLVVQYITGLIPKSTEINPDGSGIAKYGVKPSGCSKKLEELPIKVQREGACLLAAMYQAGDVAERIYTNTSVAGICVLGGIDGKASRKLLGMVRLSTICRYPDLLAKKILNNRWDMVQKVAEKLLLDGRIEWNEKTMEALETE